VPEHGSTRIVVGEAGLDLDTAVQEFEHRLIAEALRRTKGNKQAAARLLGVKRTTLVAKLRRRAGGMPYAVGALGHGFRGRPPCGETAWAIAGAIRPNFVQVAMRCGAPRRRRAATSHGGASTEATPRRR